MSSVAIPLSITLGNAIAVEHAAVEAHRETYLRCIAEFDERGLYRSEGFARMTDYLTKRLSKSPGEAYADLQLAQRLFGSVPNAMPQVAAAVEAGDMTLGQAAEIARSTKELEPTMFADLEGEMVDLARRVQPGQISKVAEQIKAQQLKQRKRADDAAAAAARSEQERLRAKAEQEQRTLEELNSRYLKRTDLGRMTRIEGLMLRTDADILWASLAALASPRSNQCDTDAEPDKRSYAQRLIDGLTLLARRTQGADHDTFVPGPLAHVQTIVPIDDLLERTGIDPRLSCLADISVTVVKTPHSGLDEALLEKALYALAPALGGNGFEILEQGRTKRLATAGQRKALKAKFRGCAYPGCSMPYEFTEAHHATDWQLGGRTDINDMCPLCSPHHHLIHANNWQMTHDQHGNWDVNKDPHQHRNT